MPEKCQSSFAPGLLQVSGAQFGGVGDERKAHLRGHCSNEFRVAARFFAAQLMVEMQHSEGPNGKFAQQVQQADGIHPAGNGDADMLSRRDHPIPLHRGGDALGETLQCFPLYGWYTGGSSAVPKGIPKPQLPSPATWKLRLALIAIVLVAYGNAFGLGAALDGTILVSSDSRTQALTWENVRTIVATDYWWPQSTDRLYRPLTIFSFLINYSVLGNGANAAGYHAINIALHALNVLLVFALAIRLFQSRWPAFFAAAVWAVHPIGVESVTNIAGRADLLAAAGLLGAVLIYASGKITAARSIAIFALALAAALAKETGAVLLALFALWEVTIGNRERRHWRELLPANAAAALALVVYAALRSQALGRIPWPVEAFAGNPLRGAGFWAARWTAVRMLGTDLALLVWPARLSADHAFRDIPIAGPADWGAWASAAVIATIGIALWRRGSRPLAFAAGLFAITLLPASNLIVLIGATVAERFLYLPAIGFAIAAANLVYRLVPARAALLLGVFAALLAGRTLMRSQDWDSTLTLMRHDAGVAPASYRVHDLYGEHLYAANPANLDAAIGELETAWAILSPLPDDRIDPQTPGALGTYYGLKADAAANPEDARACRTKAIAILERAEAATRASERAYQELQQRHGKPPAPPRQTQQLYILLAKTYVALGREPETAAAFGKARAVAPYDPAVYDAQIAMARAAGDQAVAALAQLEKTLAAGVDPQSIAAVAQLYRDVPGGECAVSAQGGVAMLNPGCARLHTDLCAASSELAKSFETARRPARAAGFGRLAAQYGCR